MQKKRLYDILLIFGLIGAFGFLGWAIWKNNGPEKPAEIKILPETVRAAGSSVETAQTEDGQRVATFLSYPKYYQDEKKEWQAVETAIVKNEIKDVKLPSGQVADWKVDKGVWKFYATNDGAVAADNAGIQLETKLKSLVYFDAETKKVATIYSRDTQQVVVSPVIAQNQIIWPSIIEGIDYKITYINDLMKEDIVMSDDARKKLPTPESLGIPSDRAYLGFLFERPEEQVGGLKTFVVETKGRNGSKGDEGGRREVDYGVKGFETEGAVEFMDEKGNKVQTIESGFTAVIPGSSSVIPAEAGIQGSETGSPIRSGMTIEKDKQLPLLKRFYKDNPGQKEGQKFLFSGSKYSEIKNLGEGDLLFDPTVSFQQKPDSSSFIILDNDTVNNVTHPTYLDTYDGSKALIRFQNLVGLGGNQIPAGATIKKAALALRAYGIYIDPITTRDVYKMLDQWNSNEYNAYPSSIRAQVPTGGSSTAYVNDADGITASETAVALSNAFDTPSNCSTFPTQGLLLIESEMMWYTSCASGVFSGLIRGISGTTAATHADNALADSFIDWVESGGSDGPSGSSVGSFLGSITFSDTSQKQLDITSAVQDWIDDLNSNYGVVIETTSGSNVRIASSSYSDVSYRPMLVVSYTVGESGKSAAINAYESNDASVSPSSPGTATTATNFAYATEAEDSGFWTTALSTTDAGYDSQVFKMQVPSATSTAPITVNWKGHGESAATNNTVSLNIWNFNSSAWEQLSSGAARYNDTFTDLSTGLGFGSEAVNAVVLEPGSNKIYIGGYNGSFKVYDPAGGGSFTDKTSAFSFNNAFFSLAFDSSNQEIYAGGYNGRFRKYNPAQNVATDLIDKVVTFLGTNNVYALAFDSSRNIIYLGGQNGKFAKYDPATGIATDLTSQISSFWSTNTVFALAFDSANKVIYLGGGSGKFAKYDPATGIATDLTSKISSFWSTYNVNALAFDSANNAIYLGGQSAGTLARYIPAMDTAENLGAYLPLTQKQTLYASSFDPSNKSVYAVGGAARVLRYFPGSLSTQNLTNSAYDAFGNIQLNASVFANGVLYIGGNSGKFGKYAVPSNTALSGSVSSSIENYRDSSGYAWLWVKAINEWSPPSVSGTGWSSFQSTVTWTSGEGADGEVAYDITSHSSGSWGDYACGNGSAYCGYLYETDAGWKTSHSVADSGRNCGYTYYFRVRSCDQWGSCTVSAENSYYPGACGGTCPHLYLWNGEKWNFETNTFGSGGLAKLQAGTPGFAKPIPNQIYTFDKIVPNPDGQLEVREFSDLDEINYFDRLKLYSVNIPEDYTLASENPTIGSPPDIQPKLHTFKTDLAKLQSAKIVETGEDVLDKISDTDKNILTLGDDPEKYDYKTLELDFGDISQEPVKKLVVMGNSTYPQTKEGIERKKQFGKPEKLFVEDQDGGWVEVPPAKANFIKPPPFDIYQVFDLSNIFISDRHKIRIQYLYKTYLDQIALDFTPDYSPLEKMEIQPDSMILRGYNYFHPFDEDGGRPDYAVRERLSGRQDYPGYYTRYGDVSELMREADDKFVTIAKGDEVAATFDIPTDQVPEGMKRAYVVDTYGFYKAEGKSQVPMTVDPLPFAKMSNFPYPAEEYPYANDADYQNYLKTYNTRLIDENHKYTDYLPWQEKINSDVKNIFEKGQKFLEDLMGAKGIKGANGQYTMHAENSNGSADTDFIEMSVDSNVRLKGGVTLPGGVRLK